ncbi:O-acetylhomoserine aminocarboxypropyltransferase/cysteine synthase [Francisella sp. Scap27]|uniref:O-acetylhomoserine aminocarboxypropyltransferase/cysteine synthase family protein n=1 Tax=Francisella sp. Scap27 TaxID=2589986 RepID=UPI0015B85C90|nr:O-acetylhomoserine aminocarboxypropyltransferase/cysteine synthase family protein [Francisella sp. Scap27]QLE79356.1 O-acetylhomoserine aminocarboxypropyltransferase/cysteine synthase [Francisella sp. Scap27]
MNKYSLETLALHQSIPAQSGSVQIPIHQTSSYVFESIEQAADLFALKEFGNIYSRLTNPTVDAYASRLAKLHNVAGAFACSSGHAAQLLIFLNLLQSGDHIVASKYLYGGSITQLTHTFPRQFGWQSTLVDINDFSEVKNAIKQNTKAIFIETQSNPSGVIADIQALADIAHSAGIPLIVDNTVATPYLLNPIDYGADIVSYSLTKYLGGNGSIVGGAVVDSGKFDWSQNEKFPLLSKPDSSYNNISFYDSFKELAFTVRGIAVGLRDIGATLSPHTAFLALQGLETLGARLDKHVANAIVIAEYLAKHPKVEKVNYSGLKNSPYHDLAKQYLPRGLPGLFTIELKDGFEAGKTLVEKTQLFVHCANIGDARSLIIHPASTTHSQLSDLEKAQAGITNSLVRLSIGLEKVEDLILDLEQALS